MSARAFACAGAGLGAARGVLCLGPMAADSWDAMIVEQLLRRVQVVVQHHRHFEQPIDAREVVALVLAEHERRQREKIVQYRSILEDAVRALVHDIR